jgi:hypothetical protein
LRLRAGAGRRTASIDLICCSATGDPQEIKIKRNKGAKLNSFDAQLICRSARRAGLNVIQFEIRRLRNALASFNVGDRKLS